MKQKLCKRKAMWLPPCTAINLPFIALWVDFFWLEFWGLSTFEIHVLSKWMQLSDVIKCDGILEVTVQKTLSFPLFLLVAIRLLLRVYPTPGDKCSYCDINVYYCESVFDNGSVMDVYFSLSMFKFYTCGCWTQNFFYKYYK